jgi:hypothetical protein
MNDFQFVSSRKPDVKISKTDTGYLIEGTGFMSSSRSKNENEAWAYAAEFLKTIESFDKSREKNAWKTDNSIE